MKYKAGFSGNPNGRPKGALNKRTLLAQQLDQQGEALLTKAIQLALEGDVTLLRLLIERLLPRAKHLPLAHELASLDVSQLKALGASGAKIIASALNEQIDLEQANGLLNLLQTQGKIIELSELDQRISAMEAALNLRQEKR